jgi:diacylglycerol kinase (ATP)
LPRVVSTAAAPQAAKRVVVLMNPKAGPRASQPWVDGLAAALKRRGYEAEVFTDLAIATAQANQWHGEGSLRALVGAGGDGTAAELVNRTADGVPITLLPMGNENLLARYFHLGREPESLCRTIAEGVLARVDAGRANGRIFLLMASCGFDAEVVRRVHERRTGHVSHLSYLKPVAETIWRYGFPEIHVESEDGNRERTSARWLFVFNLPCYGGGFRIAPLADGSDGLLDLCTFRKGHFMAGAQLATAVMLRMHHRLRQWRVRRVRRLRITSDHPVPYQLDGDPGGMLPLEIEVLPGRLTLLVPSEAASANLGAAPA